MFKFNVYERRNFPNSGTLEVITTTPLDPRLPYIAVALASFNIVIEATVLSSISTKRSNEISTVQNK